MCRVVFILMELVSVLISLIEISKFSIKENKLDYNIQIQIFIEGLIHIITNFRLCSMHLIRQEENM